jgi:glutathione S-transferase
MAYTIHIGDKAYSSWSLRGWLLLAAFDLPFEEAFHRLRGPEMDTFRATHPPAATVPMLAWEEGGETVEVWDSLAIAETLAERHPEAGHWPAAPAARALARALAAEMHSGFGPLRREAPMNTRRGGVPLKAALSADALADLGRLEALWAHARDRFGAGGPYLFGAAFTAADAFFAPIAWRVRGYGLPMGAAGLAYLDALLDHPAMRRWTADAAADPRRVDFYEAF